MESKLYLLKPALIVGRRKVSLICSNVFRLGLEVWGPVWSL